METNNITLTSEAVSAIESLRRPAGTLDVYRNTITRIYNQVLYVAEDLGMDEIETLNTLRALDMLRRDLTAIATTPDEPTADDEADEEPDDEEASQFQDKKGC